MEELWDWMMAASYALIDRAVTSAQRLGIQPAIFALALGNNTGALLEGLNHERNQDLSVLALLDEKFVGLTQMAEVMKAIHTHQRFPKRGDGKGYA